MVEKHGYQLKYIASVNSVINSVTMEKRRYTWKHDGNHGKQF